MRMLLALTLAGALASSASASTVYTCKGRHLLQVDWQAALLTIDGTSYQMHKDRTGKKSATLRGNGITYIHVSDSSNPPSGHNVLEMGGARETYHCAQSEEDDSAARRNAVAYRPNATPTDTSVIDDTPEGSRTSTAGDKGKGGHGRNK